MFYKKVLLKISQNLQENTCGQSLFLNKVTRLRPAIKNFAIFIEKHLRWSLFLNKNVGFQSWNFIKKRLQHRFFPVTIAKLLRTSVLENICERLFQRFSTWSSNKTRNMGIEEDIFSKAQKKMQNLAIWKNLHFHNALDHFVFLCISTACSRRRLPYIIKGDRSEEL